MTSLRAFLIAALMSAGPGALCAGDGNRLAYLDENNPWYPHTGFPKLTTPQWVGEEGVEAVVILAIDDMRQSAKYEQYLRPILIRLKQIDGRAPVSIMTCSIDPKDEQLQAWLAEGLSIECHTIDHPCPLLQGGDFQKAASTYHRCVDLMNQIPGNNPLAHRMPCCDSLNTVSPRFFSEIFNRTTANGNFLQADTSVFTFYTSNDPEIPRELVLEKDGSERFLKYVPRNLKRGQKIFDTFVNTIENYPYPYIINGICWEFPCMAPSDWSAQHRHGVNNPKTVADWKRALDITVLKQGVFCMVFHPHGWIRSDQIVDLIDHADKTYGGKVKFLTFREALERLNRHLLASRPVRDSDGNDNGVQLLDFNGDGYMDVMISEKTDGGSTLVRRWDPGQRRFRDYRHTPSLWGLQAGIEGADGIPILVGIGPKGWRKLRFEQGKWSERTISFAKPTDETERRLVHRPHGFVRNVSLRDLDGDGWSEMLVYHTEGLTIFRQDRQDGIWHALPFSLPAGVNAAQKAGQARGARFIDLNQDGKLDLVFSNAQRYGIWLFEDIERGWNIALVSGRRGQKRPEEELPPIVRADGSDNGFFVHSRHLFWQNEETADLPDLVDRRSLRELLGRKR